MYKSQAFAQIRAAMSASRGADWRGAQVLGLNAEGPFINPVKKGAQAGENIRPGDAAFLEEYLDILRVFTIAPETVSYTHLRTTRTTCPAACCKG